MGKIAFVFAGQGAQYSGMGKSLYENFESAKNLYAAAESIRPGTMAQSFEGSAEELKITKNTQPCLYLVDLISALCLKENGIIPDAVAGFSLGEIAALAFAGAYTPEEGFRIVSKRAECMQKAAEAADTAMCAVVKLDAETIVKAASEVESMYAVNFNSPAQTVCAGLKSSMTEFSAKIKALGGRCIPLAVNAAFHSPYMNSAAEEFRTALDQYEITVPSIPVYANYTAQPYPETADSVKDMLGVQICNPVRWCETVEHLISEGFTDFIEVGAGKTLSGLIGKIDASVRVYNVDSAETLQTVIDEVKKNG